MFTQHYKELFSKKYSVFVNINYYKHVIQSNFCMSVMKLVDCY